MNCVESGKAQFFALNKVSTWNEGTASGVEIGEKGIRLAQHLEYTIRKKIAEQEIGIYAEVVDFAIGACDLIYVLVALDQTRAVIWTYDLSQDLVEQVGGIELLLESPTSIALAPGRLYIANRDGEKRIIALALPSNRTEWVKGPQLGLGQEFTPIDLVADSRGVVFALDERNRVIVSISADGTSVNTFGEAALSKASPTSIALYDPFLGKTKPSAVTPDDTCLYVLDETGVIKFETVDTSAPESLIDFQELMGFVSTDRPPDGFKPCGLAVDSMRRIYVGDGRPVPPKDVEDDRFLHKFDACGRYLTPIAGFRGSVELLAIDRLSTILLLTRYETEQQQIVVLEPKEPKTLRTKSSSVARGDYVSKAFDSTIAGTQWHKLALEATIPTNTQLRVAHYIAEDDLLPDVSAWSEPIEFSPDTVNKVGKALELTALIRESETCPARGRYLRLKLTLIGGEQGTPEVKNVRIYFPRVSYLRYLPAVHQENTEGRDFLERFLALFETFFADIEQKIDHITRYFDADGVSNEFLHWLAGWLAIGADEDWTNEQIRSLMKQAPALFRRRGTRSGIEELIRIFTGDHPFILEPFQIPSATTEEDILKRLYQSYPDSYSFYVFLKPNQAQQEIKRTMVRQLVDTEKPAHTHAHVLSLAPWIFLDGHTYLGVNTYLSEPPARLDMGAPLGDTRLAAPIIAQ